MRITNIKLFVALAVFFLLLVNPHGYAQKSQQFINTRSFDGVYTDFTVDILGNLYLLNAQNNLKKINANGDSAAVYNNVRSFGRLTTVNVTNPLKILLFYQQFSTIVILDRFLNRRNSIDLRKQNIFSVKAISPSYDNNIWIFDAQDNKLRKIDDEGKTLSESVDFRNLFDSIPSPTRIIDRDGFVYLYDSEKGVYIFDYYGAFKSKLTFLHWKDIEVIGKNIYGFDDKNYYVYQNKSLDLKQFALPLGFKEYSTLHLGNDRVYILKKGKVQVYELK